MKKPFDIFCCYARPDQSYLLELKQRLIPLQREGLILVHADVDISPGEEWERKIQLYLDTAHIILLFISPDFMALDYCYSVEMKRALERHDKGEALVIPIIVRPVAWERAPFSKLQVLPRNRLPISRQADRDEAFLEVTRNIHKAVEELNKKAPMSDSSNLPMPPHITDDSLNRPHILVVDNDDGILYLIRLACRYEGFDASFVTSGEDALNFIQEHQPDLVILDIKLGDGIDGLEVCHRLRTDPKTHNMLVIMLSEKHQVEDRIRGLDWGADDYLPKFGLFVDELLARIRALLRRRDRLTQSNNVYEPQFLQFGDLSLDIETHIVKQAERTIELTNVEYRLLHLFMSHPRQVLDRQSILDGVWGYDFIGDTSVVEVYIRYLREKIEDSPSLPRLIQTVRGVGYVLRG